MKTHHHIIIGDSRRMDSVRDASAQLVITSPPYWQLKDYGADGQIGFDDTYEAYINNLNLVWQECERVLSPGCRLCINIGDQFARSVYYGRYKVIPIRTEIIRLCETMGMDYMGAVIWQKVTTTNTTGGATIMGSFPYPRNGILKLDYEFILIFKKLGEAPRPEAHTRDEAKLTTEEWNTYFAGHWNFPGEKQEGHIARFPVELPHRLIRMFSFPGETVLDPFAGSGTTNVAAARLNRNSIGVEINPEFAALATRRLESEKSLILNFATSVAQESPLRSGDITALHSKLPYVFEDKVKMGKKTDPRKRLFGSKITGKEENGKQDFRVSRIISGNEIELEGGQVVRLLGVAPYATKGREAIDFLCGIFKGQRVMLKFDNEKYDPSGRLLAYVYLANKTFVNGHILKQGLAKLDTTVEFSKREALKKYIEKGRITRAD
jgi:DNA modification methylase/endonuclease YncB( thermonuclease family)